MRDTGTMPRARTARMDNIKARTGLPVEESIRMTSTSMVWPTVGSRTAKVQNRLMIVTCYYA